MTAATVVVPTSSAALSVPAVRPRLDLYVGIHKALRGWMAETLVRVGRIDVADAFDLEEGLCGLEQLLGFCADHLRHENDFIHTAIEARQPAGVSKIAEEHVDHLESIAALRDEASALRAAGPETAPALALRLYRHLALFVAENLQHMHAEETVHNALLWQHYSDAELGALHGRLLASLSPRDKLTTARWMVPALSPAERAGMVAGMAAEMPPEALLGVMTMLRPHLDARGWTKIAAAARIDPAIGA